MHRSAAVSSVFMHTKLQIVNSVHKSPCLFVFYTVVCVFSGVKIQVNLCGSNGESCTVIKFLAKPGVINCLGSVSFLQCVDTVGWVI